MFDDLLWGEKINHHIALAPGPSGRSLVTTKDVAAGDVLLSVPKKLLITTHRSGVVGGLQGQTDLTWEAAGDLREEVGEDNFNRGARWDARLAVGVFEASSGAGGTFWDVYRRLLPTPPKVAHPLTLPESLLAEIQDSDLESRVRALRTRLVELYPDLDCHECHPATAAYERMGAPMEAIPMPLQYTYALVVSRCFAMADGDTFAFVPFLDMADHEAMPSANFGSDARGFVLRALRPIPAGGAVTICYGEDYSTSRLFEQYGFVPADGTAQDATWLAQVASDASDADAPGVAEAREGGPSTDLGSSMMGMQALSEAFERLEASALSTTERRAAIFDALVPAEEEASPPPPPAAAEDDASSSTSAAGRGSGGEEEEEEEAAAAATEEDAEKPEPRRAVPPGVLLAAVRWKLASFETTLDEDEATLAAFTQPDEGEGTSVDQRAVAVLEYRLARKRLLRLAEETLGTFLGA